MTADHPVGESSLRRVLLLTVLLFMVEVAGGFLSNSLALLSDAGHMLVDISALGLALLAATQGRRPRDLKRTYGYRRLEILAALANGALLVFLAGGILREAWLRLRTPPAVRADLMLGVAVAGLLANIVGLWLLHRHRASNLNLRAAFYHVAGDALGSAGAIVAALLIRFADWSRADALVSILISALMVLGGVRLLRESLHYLLEGAPREIPVNDVERCLRRYPGVVEVHDLHLWRISSGMDVLTAHVVLEDPSRWHEAQCGLGHRLRAEFGLTHATLQIEGREELASSDHMERICDDR